MIKQSKALRVFCDGSVTKNPGGGGGWAYAVVTPDNSRIRVNSGHCFETTNNRMELMAIWQGSRAALDVLVEYPNLFETIEIYTDSEYCFNLITKKTRAHANLDLVIPILQGLSFRSSTNPFKIHWIRGHQDNSHHNFVDELARTAAFSRSNHK